MISSRGRSALATVEGAATLEALEAFAPVVVGTFPLGLERSGSDIDILCFADDIEMFTKRADVLFGDWPGFSSHRRVAISQKRQSCGSRWAMFP